ncbi:hypothetical protein SOASR030_28630 [Leminorella grimontii]|uniref:Uncharacterized protein n=1 Tax=Leminorella grimontii TaxID=82981 RepID=A0AAV5N3T7_9GAMM|nr:hypothetical protein [Leminorella grimontii]KFC92868.1 hypothetical protein GLGR_3564 [Leminorella grimontii ATCC 33999 = DSM 5078]GKX56751.1 hypothetical protein SOASR030_28630 [Leminorella grimontii]VFS62225.1 Uncharacterised protein [Leminorella grimontii]
MNENIKIRFERVVRCRSVKLWHWFMVAIGVMIVLSMFFLDRYRGYGVEYILDSYGVKYKNSGVIFYGGSSIFITLLCIGGITQIFLYCYVFFMEKSRFISQMGLSLLAFFLLSVLSFIYIPPTANFEMTVYHKDATSSEYAWAWPGHEGIKIVPISISQNDRESKKLYIKEGGVSQYFYCVTYYYRWSASIQIKENVWRKYFLWDFEKNGTPDTCKKLTGEELDKLSNVNIKNALTL